MKVAEALGGHAQKIQRDEAMSTSSPSGLSEEEHRMGQGEPCTESKTMAIADVMGKMWDEAEIMELRAEVWQDLQEETRDEKSGELLGPELCSKAWTWRGAGRGRLGLR